MQQQRNLVPQANHLKMQKKSVQTNRAAFCMKRIIRTFFGLGTLDVHYWGVINRLLYNFILDLILLKKKAKNLPSVRDDSTLVMGIDYYFLQAIFKIINIEDDDVIVEVGCGHGRVIAWLLRKKIKNTIKGYELNKEIAHDATKIFERYPNVSIKGDIFENFPSGSLFFLNNPFTETSLSRFLEKILEIKRPWKMIYATCYDIHLNVFQKYPQISTEIHVINNPLLGIHNKRFVIVRKNHALPNVNR